MDVNMHAQIIGETTFRCVMMYVQVELIDACTNGRAYKRGCLKRVRDGLERASGWLSAHFREYNVAVEFVEVQIQVLY